MRISGILGVLVLTGFALSVEIHPVPVVIDKEQSVARLYVKAQDRKTFKVIPVSFDEKEEVKDLVVYPQVITTPAVVRIGYAGKDRQQEKAFRVVLQEVVPEGEGVRVALSFSVPVFVKPERVEKGLDISCVSGTLRVHNRGNVHLKVLSVAGKEVDVKDSYILPEQERTYSTEAKGEVDIKTAESVYKVYCK